MGENYKKDVNKAVYYYSLTSNHNNLFRNIKIILRKLKKNMNQILTKLKKMQNSSNN